MTAITKLDLSESVVRRAAPRFVGARLASMLAAFAFAAVSASAPVRAEEVQHIERISFSNAEIIDGFFKVAFGAELGIAGTNDRIRKFDRPVRIFLDNRANANRRADLAAVVADIARHVAHLDIATTSDRNAANIVVTLVRDHAELVRTLRAFYGHARARDIERRLAPQCLSGFSEYADHGIRRAEVILTAEGGDFAFLNCAYEELLQALGPINDDRSVPWTMFNDDVQMGYFDIYDQYILNILYDPRVRPGMTKEDVAAILPAILPTVRTWIAQTNPLPHIDAAADLERSVPGSLRR
jgi:hypothetical protein